MCVCVCVCVLIFIPLILFFFYFYLYQHDIYIPIHSYYPYFPLPSLLLSCFPPSFLPSLPPSHNFFPPTGDNNQIVTLVPSSTNPGEVSYVLIVEQSTDTDKDDTVYDFNEADEGLSYVSVGCLG